MMKINEYITRATYLKKSIKTESESVAAGHPPPKEAKEAKPEKETKK